MTGCGDESPLHWSSQLDVVEHDSEHEPVQRTVHVAPSAHDTLPLGPTVTSHDALAAQLMLHDAPHAPEHIAPASHANVQLEPLQPEFPMSHVVLAEHVHVLPLHFGGGG